MFETTIHFFLHCPNFNTQRQTLFDKTTTTYANILTENENSVVNTLLFGKPNSENSFNKAMLNASIKLFYQLRDLIIHYSNYSHDYVSHAN